MHPDNQISSGHAVPFAVSGLVDVSPSAREEACSGGTGIRSRGVGAAQGVSEEEMEMWNAIHRQEEY
jgi:hypothetical protein